MQPQSLANALRAAAFTCLAACLTLLAPSPAIAQEPGLVAPLVYRLVIPPAGEMRMVIKEFEQKLPAQRRLAWTDPETHEPREWAPSLAPFRAACLQARFDCARLLAEQLRYLRMSLLEARGKPATLRGAIAWSLLTELCGTARNPALEGSSGDFFTLCEGQAGTAGQAAAAWLELGYDELFAAYLDVYEGNRQTTVAWLASRPADDQAARQQRTRLEAMTSLVANARRAELADNLDVARDQWLLVLLREAQRADRERGTAAQALLHLARLSYRLKDEARAEQWRQAAEGVIAGEPKLREAPSCGIEQQRALIALARRGASPAAPGDGGRPDAAADLQALRHLAQQQCGFSELALQAALEHLAQARYREADTVIEFSLAACAQPDACAPSRLRYLGELRVITRGDAAALGALSARLREEARLGPLDAAQRLSLAALARALAERDGRRAEALAVIEALDGDLQAARATLSGLGKGRLMNLARHDEWSRWRVRLAAEQGGVLRFDLTESQRGQSLLRRLRLKRWELELAGVRDAEAQAKLREGLAMLESTRKALASAPQVTPADRALGEMLRESLGDTEAGLRELYLGALAQRQSGQARPAAFSWLGLPSTALLSRELGKAALADPHASLADDEAYLSWLGVPGGYVGTLAVPAQGAPGAPATMGRHRLLARYVPVSADMAATLILYRRLLESGAGAPRDAQAPGARADEGLELDNMTVWRLPGGTFAASMEQPPGAVRAASLAEISEALHRLLLEPFQGELEKIAKLTLSPDRELSFLPFETLRRNGVPLLTRLRVGYVQSLAVHQELTERAARRKAARPALLSLADPDYAASPPASSSAPSPASSSTVPAALASPQAAGGNPLDSLQWEALPGTREESAGIARLFPGANRWLGAQASRARLEAAQKSGELARYRVLHFATHGYVDDERSALVLSMADGPGRAYLADTDVVDFRLDADLVLLSACNTGIGRNVSGEGVMGLPYAFLLAGNSNTLMSLWQVDDKGTAAFMVRFMAKARAGVELQQALSETKREFASGAQGAAFADPRVWSAFVQYGVPLRLAP